MDHLDAENMKAVERYMLGDLSVSEVEEFERHFFDCPQCSEELRALTIFQENARAVFAEQDLAPVPVAVREPKSSAGWWGGFSPLFGSRQWAVGLGALLIGIFAGYGVFAPHESAQAVSAFPLYAQARGEETVVSPEAASKFYTLYLDKTWDGAYSSYRAVLLDAAGTQKSTVPVNMGAPGEAIHMLIPSHVLAAGKYVLVMRGVSMQSDGSAKDTELARFPFTLRFK
jgi:hypothetical protein